MENDGLSSYQIVPLERFETTYKGLIKRHYRKDRRSQVEFEDLVSDFIFNKLLKNPCSDELSDKEPFPKINQQQDFEFRKKRWNRLPGLKGAASKGRLLFAVNQVQRTVYLFWIYTHEEFQKRPSEKELQKCFKDVI